MSDQPTPAPESSEQRWERIERNLALVAELQAEGNRRAEQQRADFAETQRENDRRAEQQHADFAETQRENDRRAEQRRADFDQFKRTMAAVIESLHQTNVRLDRGFEELKRTTERMADNITQLSGIAADHHERLDELES